MTSSVERKLTTILCADVNGYSRLMGADEVGTLTRLKAYRATMEGFIARHRGRVVNTAGDGLMAEFASVVEAVQCAVEIQRELQPRNDALPPEQRMEFRIGLNLGDVMVDGDDLFGEGVNVAARLEALAEPGGICISGTVFDHVRNKLTVGYEFLGPQAVKNIADRIPVFRVRLHDQAEVTVALAGRERQDRPPLRPAHAFDGAPEMDAGRAAHPPAGTPGHGDDASQEAATDRRSRFWRRARRAGLLVAMLAAVDAVSSPDRWWFQWPGLSIAFLLGLAALREFERGTFDRPGEQPRPAERTPPYSARGLMHRAGLAAVFFFALNLLTSPGVWWFQWPVAGIAAAAGLAALGSGRRERRGPREPGDPGGTDGPRRP